MQRGTVEKIINGGWGLVRCNEGVVFLNYVLPGEEVIYKIKDRAKGILWGELIKVLTPSDYRIHPPCPYFGKCGGCIFQHIDYSFQKNLKKEIFRDDMVRIGNSHKEIPDIIDSPMYQNRIRARMKAQADGKIGFIRKGTHCIIPIKECLLFPKKINQFLNKWNNLPNPPFFHQMDILLNHENHRLYIHLSHPPQKKFELIKQFPEIQFSWKGNEDIAVSQIKIWQNTYHISPAVFFQVNPFQWLEMLKIVDGYLDTCHKIIDLYSGVGFFIPILKKHCQEVIGVESEPYSVKLSQHSFKNDGIEIINQSVEKFQFQSADVIVVDPPRSGLSKLVMKKILYKNYKKIIYISCSSASFSRDSNILCQNGYTLRNLQLLDLFPQTPHIESIGLFIR